MRPEGLDRERPPEPWLLHIAAGAACLAASVMVPTTADPDLWGHLRFGLDLLRTHRLTAVDPYSFTQDRPWLNHEWLSELQMAAAYTAGGSGGLLALKALLVSLTLWLVWRALRGLDPVARLLLLATVTLGVGRAVATMRPQLWSIGCFALLASVLAGGRPLWRWLPFVFVFWANVHGGWIVGLGVLVLHALGQIYLHRVWRRGWVALTAVCAIATLGTPYTWRLWTFVWETVGLGRDVSEWRPLWTVPAPAWLPWIAAAGATARSLVHTPRRWPERMSLVVLACVSLRVERVAPFFVIATVVLLASEFRERWPARQSLRVGRSSALLMSTLATMAAISLAASLRGACIPVTGAWIPDADGARLLRNAGAGRLVTFFDWGEYSLWHWGDRLMVSTDGRRETVYTDRALQSQDEVVHGTARGLETLARWSPEYVWLPAVATETRDWLAARRYQVLTTRRSFVAVRSDLPPLPSEGAAQEGNRCFPD
ncbi:MAG: hypothetical protein ABI051_18510 [Vicinamibacterales bacterium]